MATFTEEALNVRSSLYIKEESTEGTMNPPVGADFISVIGDFTPPIPVRTLAQNLERDGYLSQGEGFLLKAESASLDFSTYIKPAGSLGVVPVGAALYKALFGTQTINASTSVVYTFSSLETGIPSLTIQARIDHMDFWFSAKVNQAVIPLVAGGGDEVLVPVNWNLLISKLYAYAGKATGTTTGANSTVTLATGEARRFKAGALIKIGTDDNGGSGWPVVSVDTGADTLTVTGTPSAQSSQPVIPHRPTPAEPTGYPQAGYIGIVQEKDVGGTYDDFKITTANITINNKLFFRNDEKDNDAYAGKVLRVEKRDVTLNTVGHFYKEYGNYFGVADGEIAKAIQIPVGTTSGRILQINAPNCITRSPQLGGSPVVDLTLDWIARHVNGDDEIDFTFI